MGSSYNSSPNPSNTNHHTSVHYPLSKYINIPISTSKKESITATIFKHVIHISHFITSAIHIYYPPEATERAAPTTYILSAQPPLFRQTKDREIPFLQSAHVTSMEYI